MCRVLNVCRSGFYAWLHKPLADRAIEDQRLLVLVRASYPASSGVNGAPRVFLDLREAGEKCSIIAPDATVTSAASALRLLKGPHFEGPQCHQYRGKTSSGLQIGCDIIVQTNRNNCGL